ncbi:O-antigen ligase family protein [Polymorphospora rubra]|uniref:O-antigen ligase family protein n=1 Tax=Polymorphospora rubra TaxID=338584 RepID=UPI003409C000
MTVVAPAPGQDRPPDPAAAPAGGPGRHRAGAGYGAGRDTAAGRKQRSTGPPPGLPAWPVTALLLLYPLWWALGLGVLIFPILAVPMAYALLRAHLGGRPVRLPPGFWLWAVFLAVLVVSMAALGSEPTGAVPGPVSGRMVGVLFRLVEYLAMTVLLIHAGNLTERELPVRRLVRLLGWLFVVTVAGGLLGVFAGTFEFTSPVELLLPPEIRGRGFVQSLVHPYAAQIHDIIGDQRPRPAAPWGYTNTWGNNFCLLAVWFVVAVWGQVTGRRTRLLALACLAVSVVPVVISLNRGLWIGLGLAAGYAALRLALAGRVWVLGALAAAAVVLAAALVVTPLGDVVTARLDNGKSNGVRSYLIERAVAGVAESPVIGYGSTRTTIGGRHSITVGESADCERCGNFTIGGNGQLWQLLIAHGLTGTFAYLGFLGYGVWRFRRDRSPVGIAGSCAILGSFAAMLWYNALVTPLAFMFLAYALLWRNEGRQADESGHHRTGTPDRR